MPACEPEGHAGQILNFLRAIRGEETLLVDGAQGRATVELVTAIYLSALEDRRVALPLKSDTPLYGDGGFAAHMPHFHEKTRTVDQAEVLPISLGRDVNV